MEKDYSNYQLSDDEKYDLNFVNNRYIKYNYFVNSVLVNDSQKEMFIHVDNSKEHNVMHQYIEEFEKADATRRTIKEDDLT